MASLWLVVEKMSSLACCCCDKNTDQKQQGRKGGLFGLQVTVCHQGRPRQESRQQPGGRNWPWRMLRTGLLPMAYSACFLIYSRPTSLGLALWTVSWVLLCQAASSKCSTEMPTGQYDGGNFSVEVPSSWNVSSWQLWSASTTVSSFSLVCAHGRVSPGLFTSLWIRKQGTLGSGLDITFQYSPGQCPPVRSQVPKVLQSPKVEPPAGDQGFEHTHRREAFHTLTARQARREMQIGVWPYQKRNKKSEMWFNSRIGTCLE